MSRRSRRARRAAALWLLLLGPAGLCGWFGAPWIVGHLGAPVPLDPTVWTVIVPGRDDGMSDVALVSGTGLVDGALRLSTRSLGRADLLVLRDQRPVGGMEISLAPDSAPVLLNLHGAGVSRLAEVSPTGWRTHGKGPWVPFTSAGPVRIELKDGRVTVDGKAAGNAAPGTLEIVPGDGAARLTAIRAVDTSGTVLVDETFGLPAPGTSQRAAMALLAALVAIALGLVARGARSIPGGILLGVALLALPAAVPFIGYDTWRDLVERFYLLHTSAAELRQVVFGAALVPLVAAAVSGSGLLALDPGDRRRVPLPLLAGGMLLVDGFASRDLQGAWLLASVPGLLFLLLPWWTARRAGLPEPRLVLRDAPALVMLAVAGWGPGLLPAVLWRLVCLWSDIPVLLERGPRAGADALGLTLLVLALSLETTVRATYLGEAWDPAYLAGTAAKEGEPFTAFWTGTCGAAPRNLYTFGGSSAGGAYQFAGEPEAFPTARVHAALCAAGVAVTSLNFGNSGRDTWDAATAADRLFAEAPPAVVIVYAGVNDLLTHDAPLSRKARGAVLASRGAPLAGAASVSDHVRILTGLSFFFRAPEVVGPLVTAVPIEDAEENLRHIASATHVRGAHLVLVTEYAEAHVDLQLKPYWAMEQRLAAELPDVTFVDLHAALGQQAAFLADRNHLTREGAQAVAGVLTPLVRELLGVDGPSADVTVSP